MPKIIGENMVYIISGLFLAILLIVFFGFTIYLSLTPKLREYFIDDSGKLSMGRLICFLSVFFYVVSSGYSLVSKGIFPDIPTNLSLLVGGLYGLNKFSPTVPFRGQEGSK